MGGKQRSLQSAIGPISTWQALLSSSPDAVIVADGRGRITAMNRVAEAATGWREVDARGKRIQDICRLAGQGVGQATAILPEPTFGRLDLSAHGLVEGRGILRPRSGPDMLVAYRSMIVPAADDCTADDALVFRFQPEADNPVLDGIGEDEYRQRILEAGPACVKVVGTDSQVLDMNVAGLQNALVQSEARFRATFEQAAVGVAHLTPGGRFIRSNRRLTEITGYTSDELSRLTFGQITHPDDLRDDAAQRARLLAGEVTTYHIEQRFLRTDGSAVWVTITTSLVTQEDGQPGYFIAVVEDITARRNLEGQLRQSQKMEAIGLLAGGVAHEFNNMLCVILGNAELSLGELPGSQGARENLQAIVEAANRGADITRQLLAFARKETALPVALDVNARLISLTRMLGRLAGEDISIETAFNADTWPIKLDPTQFDQVVVNLVTNARDAVRGVGTIELRTRNIVADAAYRSIHRAVRPGEYAAVQVSDSGVGMDAATLEQIFQPFFTTKALGKGTGLGLAVVLGISQRAGGHVLVESVPGSGTCFTLLFPKCREAVRAVIRRRALEPGLAGSETVLLVEDELPLLALARRSLESYGYHVISASAPGEALELAQQHHGEIALLLTDVVMPKMNGRELYDRISAVRPGIRVVYMSGYPSDIVTRRGELDAGSGYVQKPFALTTLARSVRGELEKR